MIAMIIVSGFVGSAIIATVAVLLERRVKSHPKSDQEDLLLLAAGLSSSARYNVSTSVDRRSPMPAFIEVTTVCSCKNPLNKTSLSVGTKTTRQERCSECDLVWWMSFDCTYSTFVFRVEGQPEKP